MSFTQQLQKHLRHHNTKNNQITQSTKEKNGGVNNKGKHSQILPNVEEYQINNVGESIDLFKIYKLVYVYAILAYVIIFLSSFYSVKYKSHE